VRAAKNSGRAIDNAKKTEGAAISAEITKGHALLAQLVAAIVGLLCTSV